MNRRTRQARRRLRRGDARREPVLLYADDTYPGESLETLGRWIYRYRSELGPVAITGAVALTGAVLHARHPDAAPLVAIVGATVAGLLAWPKVAPELRRIERVYAVTVTVTTAVWLTLATACGPNAGPMRAALLVAGIASAVPWWAHRRRRAKVRVERTLDAWPDIAENVGLPGSRVMSAVVDVWGWRARIRLRRGPTAADVIHRAPALESGLGTRPGALRVEPDPDRADRVTIRVLDSDPHARAIRYPAIDPDNERPSVTAAVPLGLFEDARPVSVRLAHKHALIGGLAGSGKSGVLNAVLARLVACPDVVLWGIDLKGGMEFGPWAACLDRLATTPEEAAQLLGEAVAVLNARAARLAKNVERLWRPTPAEPALLVIVDEYAELSEHAVALVHADSIARRGRAVAVTLLAATQRPTQKAMGAGAVRSQMDVRLCLRVRERRDVDLILGQGMLSAGWHAHTLDAPGKFLVSAPEHTSPRLPPHRQRRPRDRVPVDQAPTHPRCALSGGRRRPRRRARDDRGQLGRPASAPPQRSNREPRATARGHRCPRHRPAGGLARRTHRWRLGIRSHGCDRDAPDLGLRPPARPRRRRARRPGLPRALARKRSPVGRAHRDRAR